MVDHVLLATGYKPNLANIAYLHPRLDRIETTDGFPALDEHFQTSVHGLFMPGFVATRDFGPFFGFVRGCPAAATLIIAALLDHQGQPGSAPGGTLTTPTTSAAALPALGEQPVLEPPDVGLLELDRAVRGRNALGRADVQGPGKRCARRPFATDVEARDGSLRVCIRDDGIGGAELAGGSGLVGLKDRVEALGGRIALQSKPAVGTSLWVELRFPTTEPRSRLANRRGTGVGAVISAAAG